MSARCKKCGGPVDEPARCTNGHAQPQTEPLDRLAEVLGEQLDYDRLAELVATRLRGFVSDLVAAVPEPGALVDANTIARLTGMSSRWVYDHADELEAIRAGGDPAAVALRPCPRTGSARSQEWGPADPADASICAAADAAGRAAAGEGQGAMTVRWSSNRGRGTQVGIR